MISLKLLLFTIIFVCIHIFNSHTTTDKRRASYNKPQPLKTIKKTLHAHNKLAYEVDLQKKKKGTPVTGKFHFLYIFISQLFVCEYFPSNRKVTKIL